MFIARLTRWIAAALCFSSLAAVAQSDPPTARPSKPIPGRYIVVFKDSVADPDAESQRRVQREGGTRHHVFRRVLKGFSATLPDAAVRRLRADPSVAFVEQDQEVTPSGSGHAASWGLDRIDQVDRPLDLLYHYRYTGAGVYAFILDTGIRATHVEFGGRVEAGYDGFNGDGHGTNDCNGHGTHVAGTVGGQTHGVARSVKLVPVRVLSCSGPGSSAGVIAGIDYVINDPRRPAVINMSLGGARSAAMNAAVAKAVAAGVPVVAAAGNEGIDACDHSPSSAPEAITVGATNRDDARTPWSNKGSCVDIFAPGRDIASAWIGSDTEILHLSGTSMAAPHVAGVAALALEAAPTASAYAVSEFIVSRGIANRLHADSLGAGSPNLLLYSLGEGVPGEPLKPTIAVRSLSGHGYITTSTSWQAHVAVAVRDVTTGAAYPNATITGQFAPGSGASCVTNASGVCFVFNTFDRRYVHASTFTVTGITASNAIYDASQNSATQVVVHP
jgi:hypothetical protein